MKRSNRRLIRDYGITIFVAVSVALLMRNFVVEAYRVPSLAMKPTLMSGDTIFVAKWPYRIEKTAPQRGDVVVFSAPADSGTPGNLNYIRRIIGVGGDQILIQKGLVTLNGKKLAHNEMISLACPLEILPDGKSFHVCRDNPVMEDFGPEKVPLDCVFVLGDQRTQPDQKKRKAWKIIPTSSIKGKAVYTWLSIEPHVPSESSFSWLPKFRLDRMFRRIQ